MDKDHSDQPISTEATAGSGSSRDIEISGSRSSEYDLGLSGSLSGSYKQFSNDAERQAYEEHLTQMQEQLISTMIDNQSLGKPIFIFEGQDGQSKVMC